MKNVNKTFNFFQSLRDFTASSFILLLVTLLNISPSHAIEADYWSQEVNVFNFSCTDGDVDCWTDKRNSLETLPLEIYNLLSYRKLKVNIIYVFHFRTLKTLIG
tara:strand:+ start:107 stop:418 length:312 start_codon:yes stop_codon:yes gene_type:complete